MCQHDPHSEAHDRVNTVYSLFRNSESSSCKHFYTNTLITHLRIAYAAVPCSSQQSLSRKTGVTWSKQPYPEINRTGTARILRMMSLKNHILLNCNNQVDLTLIHGLVSLLHSLRWSRASDKP